MLNIADKFSLSANFSITLSRFMAVSILLSMKSSLLSDSLVSCAMFSGRKSGSRGTATALNDVIAMNVVHHSAEFLAHIAIWSPCLMPQASNNMCSLVIFSAISV